MVYINVPFSRDNMTTTGYETLKGFAEEQMQSGRTCVIADTRHTERWCGIEPTLCRGDLAFYCNDKAIQDELVEWARCRENGNPRCTDDLEQTEFADVLAGLAECHHIDKCVDAAFVGTTEEAA